VDHQRSTLVLGNRLKQFRKDRGWTQQELADRSGYCDRLIRKAERGGPVSEEALQVLAMTLSDQGFVVTALDLKSCSEASTQYLLELLQPTSNFQLMTSSELWTENVVVDCKRVEKSLPISGRFVGHEDFLNWCRFMIQQPWLQVSPGVLLVDHSNAFIHVQMKKTKLPLESVSSECEFDLDLRIKLDGYRISQVIVLSDLNELSDFARDWNQRTHSLQLPKTAQALGKVEDSRIRNKTVQSQSKRLLHGI
jgi:transcriptional regulator with XRE-family HTH domain